MRLSYLAYTFSLAMMYFSFVLLIPIIVALIFNETSAILPFVYSGILALIISLFFKYIVPKSSRIDSINDIKDKLSKDDFFDLYANKIKRKNQILVYSTSGNPISSIRKIGKNRI